MQLTIVTEDVVRKLATLDLAFDAVADALRGVASDEAQIAPVVFAEGGQPGAAFGVKTATHLAADLMGLKVGSYFPDNPKRGIPSHGSTTMLLHAETGLPTALVSAGYLNGLRTAAANAVAVDRLARPEASVLGILGAGHQAEFEARAVAHRRPIESIRVWSRRRESAVGLVRRLQDLDAEVVVATEPQEAVAGCDIVTTVTPSREPLVRAEWVAPGTHISAMGADMVGKQELEAALVARGSCFADLPEQSVRLGEFQHAVAAGLRSSAEVVAMGDVLLGKHPGRRGSQDVTIFDSSGIATQDLHCARAIVARAIEDGSAQQIEF